MATLQDIWERITRLLPIEDFAFFMEIALDRNDVLKITSSLGLTFPGRRLSSLPTGELLGAFVEDFYNDSEMGKEAIKLLMKKVEPYKREIANLSPREVKEYLKEIAKDSDYKRPVAFALCLLLDEREEIARNFFWFLDKIFKAETRLEVDYEKIINQNTKLETMLKEKEEINKKLNEALLISKEENRKLLKEIGELRKANESLQSEVTRLKVSKETPDGLSEIKHLEKEVEKVRYFLEKLVQNENTIISIPERLQTTILRQVDEIKKNFADLIANEQKNFINLKQTIIEEIKKHQTESKSQVKEEAKKIAIERIAIFADAENLYHSAKECFNGKISYEKLLTLVTGQNRYLVKAIAYVVKSYDHDPKIGFEVKVKEPRFRSDGSAKANWDMGIALDILDLLDKIDTIVLASGDGDFVPLINYIKTKGKRIEVFSFPKNTAYDLIEVADRFYPLDEKIAWV